MAEKVVVISEKTPKAIGPYSLAIEASGFIFVSGQLGIDAIHGELVPGGVEKETRKALENMSSALQAAGSDLSNVVKTTVFLKDINDFSKMNAVYAEFFTSKPPARSAFQVAALPKGASVEIEAIALSGQD
ncbi:MAG: reactive intermediate/imine deaminase [Chloroflexi bacterium 44-23]|nr:MAG: reactive intermediate/imine deaminase [Chloroflexi bacterium 44-23]